MSLRSLLTEDGEILPWSEGTPDRYGSTTASWPAPGDGVAVKMRLEQLDSDELVAGESESVSTHRAFFPPETVLDAKDRVFHARTNRVFLVVGQPAPVASPRGVHHWEAKLREPSD